MCGNTTTKRLSAAALQIGLVLVAACLLAVRGAVGCVALYTQRKYEKWWDNDKCAFCLPAPSACAFCPFVSCAFTGSE